MSTRYLKRFFKPKSIAVFGASEKPGSMGGIVIQNLLESQFPGLLMCINPEGYKKVFGVSCYTGISALPEMPDLAIICSPPDSVPDIIRKLGAHMVKAAIILTGGLSIKNNPAAKTLSESVKEAARPYGIRILGPDCMGLLVPGSNMNASYSHMNIQKGKVAYIGQSGLLGTAMIDWANGREIGFSHFLTLGDGADVDLSSVIDYVAQDPYTYSILLQLDRVSGSSRNFISALRSASRNKLVLVLKSGIFSDDGLKAPKAPGIPDEDMVYDAALRRAGAVRVETSDQLFNALETLSKMKPLRGERLAIICNGSGPNALATDRLLKTGGKLAVLSEETIVQLERLLPAGWNPKNPVDLNADATPERFAQVAEILTKDKQVDVILSIHAPTRRAPSVETADEIVKVIRKSPRNILTCWMGRATAIEARNHCNAANVAAFITPEEAVDAFMHMVDYRRNQEVMRQTPASYVEQNTQNHQKAKKIIADAMAEPRDYLKHSEACDLLDQYDIPVQNSYYSDDIEGVIELAKELGGAVAIKALHTKNVYPFSYDDVSFHRRHDLAQDLTSLADVRHATTKLAYRVSESIGEEGNMGFCVQQMKRGFQSLQINVGITRDPTFGPIIVFGAGGFTVDVLADRHVMLPPMNMALAKELVKNSRIYKIIEEHSQQPERDMEQLADIILKLSEMVVDLPNLQGLEINPLLLNRLGVLAVDVAVSIGEKSQLAISPYPGDLEESIALKRSGRPAVVRPIRGEDEPRHLDFYNKLSPESIRMRYFYSRGVPTHQELASWTQIDYDREMAFIVSAPSLNGQGPETLGVVRVVTDPDNIRSEFSIVIRDDLQGEGLGVILMRKAVDYCRSRQTLVIEGSTLPTNKGMQGLAMKLGFTNTFNMEEEVVDMKMKLNEPTEDWQVTRLQH
ncbi:bifunctional acetate--CoA ligase family protein/GNAT family N-acetyltransferase [Neptunomonas antarctica]|uniref:Acetyltransferase n=1 Tax=Neptunomonas antarctica TaxID=619304 RepID=A0A1N7KDW4_9GAMM|nr:bifunctional acetate--CoA ligase family protein/GNAT family N-acetyltransferase [Neptunomonas antarctica]SIS59660.1 acetyltransferase [Neptunomonas antarctica]